MKRDLHFGEQQKSASNFNKYCPCHAKWISWLIRITYERRLQCAEQPESTCNFNKYLACHAKWISWLIRITYEGSFAMCGATRVSLQLYQILRLPGKICIMIDAPHLWNVIYNARGNKSHPVTSANIALATQNKFLMIDTHHLIMKRHLPCAEQQE